MVNGPPGSDAGLVVRPTTKWGVYRTGSGKERASTSRLGATMSDLDNLRSRARHRQEGTGDGPRRRRWPRPLLGSLIGLLLAVTSVAAGLWVTADGIGDQPRPEAATRPEGHAASASDGSGEHRAAEIDLRLEDFAFTVSGSVPDQATADAMTDAAHRTYGQRATVAVAVDPEVAAAAWLGRAPFLIRNFTRLLSGHLRIDGDRAVLTGTVPDRASFEFLRDALSPESGFPPLGVDGLDVTDLAAPELRATAVGRELTLAGIVPSRTLRDQIVAAAVELYGPDHVSDEIQIDPATSAPYELIRFPDDLEVFEPAGDFEIGVRQGTFHAVIADTIAFDVGESRLSPRAERLLAGFDDLVDRIAGVVTITGHTDDVGSAVDNLTLSEARAGAVAVELVAGGVDPTRLVVVGMGESEPVADNTTEQGRSRNRRVVLTIGPPS